MKKLATSRAMASRCQAIRRSTDRKKRGFCRQGTGATRLARTKSSCWIHLSKERKCFRSGWWMSWSSACETARVMDDLDPIRR
jgi:hypothetical protein